MGIILPFFMVWALFFSYATGNIALILPFLAYSMAFGSLVLYRIVVEKVPLNWQKNILIIFLILGVLLLGVWLRHHIRTDFTSRSLIMHSVMAVCGVMFICFVRIRLKTILFLAVAIISILNFTCFRHEKLIARQTDQLMAEKDPALIKFMYKYYGEHPLAGNTMGENGVLAFLPDLKDRYIAQALNPDAIRGLSHRDDVTYVIMPVNKDNGDYYHQESMRMILEKLKGGSFKVLFKGDKNWWIKIR